MASGFSWGGGRSRCFTYWQEFQKCYAQTDNPIECRPQSNDYLECLHHPKELKRAQTIQAEFIRKVEHEAKESRKAAEIISGGAIAGVGLIKKGKPEEEGAK
ncbi:hypothetical protein B0H34DRAFT_715684 [Crassisporium funariophilum]|nr:hypothetical protein B0H34DRAFT_715684 [Crassisporium funariophilum]